jgi:hypothetical protein
MTATRTARPASEPEDAARRSRAAAKTLPPRDAAGRFVRKPQTARTRASVAARKATLAATLRDDDPATLKADPDDDVACARIAAATARLKKNAGNREAARARKAGVPSARVRRSAVERLDDPPPATGRALIERVSRAIERELSQIETIVGGHHVATRRRTEAERRARTLASLARTLREVMALRAGDRKAICEDDDPVPRDLTALRLELARRLDRLVAEAETAHPRSAE